MKKLFLFILFFYSFDISAQGKLKIDSIYYLIDTINTPINERMWEIGNEGKFKYYTILCPCLNYDTKPTFSYRKDIEKGQVLKSSVRNSIKFINLPTLIDKAKEVTNNSFKESYVIFFIEKINMNFISHRVYLKSIKKPEKFVDYIILPSDSLEKKKTKN